MNKKEIALVNKNIKWEEFKAWVEETKLFNVIVEETNKPPYMGFGGIGTTIIATNPHIVLDLKNNIRINKAEDLPVEILIEFWDNSPFRETIINNNIKLIE